MNKREGDREKRTEWNIGERFYGEDRHDSKIFKFKSINLSKGVKIKEKGNK